MMSRPRHLFTLATLGCLLPLMNSCGSNDATAPAETAPRSASAEASVVTGAATTPTGPADGTASSSDTGTGTGSDTVTGTGSGSVSPDNSCTVEVSGAVSGTWTNSGGSSAFGYGPLIPDSGLGAEFFVLTCFGEGGNSISFGPRAGAEIPFGPGDYIISAASSVLDGSDSTEPMHVLTAFEGTTTNFGPSQPGNLRITQFDENAIVGTFELHLTDVLALNPVLSIPSQGDIVAIGSFHYSLTG